MKHSQIQRSVSLPRNRKPLKKARGTSTATLKRKATTLWGQYIHQRDIICMVCGRKDGKLDAHHVMIRSFAATRTDENNGILCCFKDHQLLHSDPMFAVAFYSTHYGIEGYQKLRDKAHSGKDKVMRADFWKGEIARLEGLLADV